MPKVMIKENNLWIEMDKYPLEKFNEKEDKLNKVIRYYLLKDLIKSYRTM